MPIMPIWLKVCLGFIGGGAIGGMLFILACWLMSRCVDTLKNRSGDAWYEPGFRMARELLIVVVLLLVSILGGGVLGARWMSRM